ncbi:PREDICTED: uncharacterized protein LOC109236429 [Nicotiana attenuata]|uniref:uncharacterized protein LOC109236429 n=1 Tax=Nicotiana attenuata TaxID=49451 RepID=UPI000905B169|nr:PREDICTED: uncharacterized protein LOC109236429 [Nicotiana attenuata]
MKKLWEELNTLNAHPQCNCTCTCGAKANMQKAEQDRILIQFLMGLNEVYTVVRGSILMMNPLPSIAQAFSILIQEEKQREVKPHNQFVMESASLNSSTGNNSFRTNYNTSGYNTGNVGNNANRGGYPSNKPRLFCEYCKRPGRSKDKCFKHHGYPQNSKYPSYGNNNKGKSVASNVFGTPNDGPNASEVEGDHHEQGRLMHHLTQEQYGQLLNILEKLQTGSAGEKPGDMKLTGGVVNFAGTIACSSSIEHDNQLRECSDSNVDSWILNSGASNHMTFNKKLLCNVKTVVYPYLVSLSSGYKVKVTLIGDVILSPKFIMKKGPSLKRPLEIGEVKDSLYFHYLWGPYHIPTYDGYKYFITLVDDYSRSTRTHLLTCKSNALHIIKAFVAMVENQLQTTIKTVRTDNDLEFVNASSTIYNMVSPTLVSGNQVSGNAQDTAEYNIPSLQFQDQNSPLNTASSSDSSQHTPILPLENTRPPRIHKPPTYLKDYVYTLPNQPVNTSPQDEQSTSSLSFNTFIPDVQPIDLRALATDSQHLIKNVSQDCEPVSYEEATVVPAWQTTMTQEFEALYTNNTWDLVPLPAGKRAI